MSWMPSPCVVDTNVPVTANARSSAGPDCVQACVTAIRDIAAAGRVVLDDQWLIIREYQGNLSSTGQPGVGDYFLLWVLRNQANPNRCVRVPITQIASDPDDFDEFPSHPQLAEFDPADRKFVAVAAAHGDRPPILQAFDSRWWGWRKALAECGINVEFLCEDEIAAKHRERTGED